MIFVMYKASSNGDNLVRQMHMSIHIYADAHKTSLQLIKRLWQEGGRGGGPGIFFSHPKQSNRTLVKISVADELNKRIWLKGMFDTRTEFSGTDQRQHF